jgi:hypothetical protein
VFDELDMSGIQSSALHYKFSLVSQLVLEQIQLDRIFDEHRIIIRIIKQLK